MLYLPTDLSVIPKADRNFEEQQQIEAELNAGRGGNPGSHDDDSDDDISGDEKPEYKKGASGGAGDKK